MFIFFSKSLEKYLSTKLPKLDFIMIMFLFQELLLYMVAGQWDFGNGKNKKVIIRCKQKNATVYNICFKNLWCGRVL